MLRSSAAEAAATRCLASRRTQARHDFWFYPGVLLNARYSRQGHTGGATRHLPLRQQGHDQRGGTKSCLSTLVVYNHARATLSSVSGPRASMAFGRIRAADFSILSGQCRGFNTRDEGEAPLAAAPAPAAVPPPAAGTGTGSDRGGSRGWYSPPGASDQKGSRERFPERERHSSDGYTNRRPSFHNEQSRNRGADEGNYNSRPNAFARRSPGGPSPPTNRNRTARLGMGSHGSDGDGSRSLVNPTIIRRLASARRHTDWKAALKGLEITEEEAKAADARSRGGEGWRVWCAAGRPREDGALARTRVYNMIMHVLSASKRWQEAFMLLETMQERGVEPDIFTLNAVLKACRDAGQFELLFCLLTEMRTSGSTPRGGHASLPTPDVVSFNTALSAAARAGEVSLALSLLDEMAGGTVSGSNRKSGRIAGSDDADEGARFGDGTLHQQQQQRAHGVDTRLASQSASRASVALSPAPAPTLSSYNTVLSGCKRCENAEEGLELVLKIFAAMRRGDPGVPSPDAVTFKEVLGACGRVGDWEQALFWVDTAIDDGVKLRVAEFCEAITACGKGGEWRRALSVLHDDMPAHGLEPDKFCFDMALRACADAGEVKHALEILDMHLSGSRGASDFSYSSILQALARQGDPDLAVRVLREIRPGTNRTPNCSHYGSVFVAFLTSGDEAGALAIQTEWRRLFAKGAGDRMSGRHGGGNRGGSPAFSNESVRGNGGHRDNFGGRASPANSSSRTPWSQSSPRSVPSRQAPTDQSEEIQAPGHRFQPSDLLALAALQADEGLWQECLDILETIKEVHRTTVSSARANSNELLLGSGSGNSARVSGGGSRGGLGGDTSRSGNGAGVAAEAGQTGGPGLACWREVAARNSNATKSADEAAAALRSCYELAVEAHGRAGRWEKATQLLREGSSIAKKHGLPFDPSCMVFALRACSDTVDDSAVLTDHNARGFDEPSTNNAELGGRYDVAGGVPAGMRSTDGDNQNQMDATIHAADDTTHGDGESLAHDTAAFAIGGQRHPRPRTAMALELLERMQSDAGVTPDAWCVNVAMETAIRDGEWAIASALFDQIRRRFLDSGGVYIPRNASFGIRRVDRGKGELRKTAIDPMAPTAVTYHLAMQACAFASAELSAADPAARVPEEMFSESPAGEDEGRVTQQQATEDEDGKGEEERLAERALSLIRGMAEHGMLWKRETAALAQQVCVDAGRMTAAIEIRQLSAEAEVAAGGANREFLGRWRRRDSNTASGGERTTDNVAKGRNRLG